MKQNRGQTLLEATIALAALLLILAATSTAVVTGINNSIFVRNQNTANKYAQEGMEYMKNLKDNDYTTFLSLAPSIGPGSDYCLDSNRVRTSYGASCVIGVNNVFDRKITVTQVNPGTSAECSFNDISGGGFSDVFVHSVRVTVSWNSGKCTGSAKCHKAELKSCFVNN